MCVIFDAVLAFFLIIFMISQIYIISENITKIYVWLQAYKYAQYIAVQVDYALTDSWIYSTIYGEAPNHEISGIPSLSAYTLKYIKDCKVKIEPDRDYSKITVSVSYDGGNISYTLYSPAKIKSKKSFSCIK